MTMHQQTDTDLLDQAEEEILTATLSDEDLEAAAGPDSYRGVGLYSCGVRGSMCSGPTRIC